MSKKPPRCPIAVGDYMEVAGPHAGGRSCGVVIGMTETHLYMRGVKRHPLHDGALTPYAQWQAHRRTALLGDLAAEPEEVKERVRLVRASILAGCYDTWRHETETAP